MSKSRKSLGVLLNEFAAKTSAHGIERIVFAESILWRAFWLVATVTCLGMVLFQGILLIQTFTDKPVKSDIDVTYSRVSFVYISELILSLLSDLEIQDGGKSVLDLVEGSYSHGLAYSFGLKLTFSASYSTYSSHSLRLMSSAPMLCS